jgi:Helix-turn-helix domain
METLPELGTLMPASQSLVDLLHHPVRWRITQALISRELTTAELAAELPEVPTTTLYRQVGILVKAGVLQVTGERQVRGAVERTYALDLNAGDADHEGIGPDRLRTMFTVFVAGLGRDLDRYLEQGEIDPVADGVAFRQAALWLSDDEFTGFVTEYGALLERYRDNAETRGRRRRILSTVLIPDRRD